MTGQKFLALAFQCHGRPDRSFFFRGKPLPLCARCTGILAGYGIGLLGLFLFPGRSLWLELGMMIPLTADGLLQLYTPYESKNVRRLVTGILFGIAVVFILTRVVNHGYQLGRSI